MRNGANRCNNNNNNNKNKKNKKNSPGVGSYRVAKEELSLGGLV